MTQTNDSTQLITKSLLKSEINVSEERLAKMLSDGFQMIAEQFDKQNKILATKADKRDLARLERSLTATITITNENAKTLNKLKRAMA